MTLNRLVSMIPGVVLAATLAVAPLSAARPQTATQQAKKTAQDAADQAGKTASSAADSAKSEVTGKPTQAQIDAAKASGKVWVNTDSGVYHKSGQYFGNTKHGKFMTEQDAQKAGYHVAKNEKNP